jgi:hypothetical protein
MRSRAVVRILTLAALVAASGCSKTDDVALERKVFGETPRIESFEVEFNPAEVVSCDITEEFLLQLCATFDLRGLQASAPIVVSGKLGSLLLRAHVTDADTTTEQDNILLVAASYILDGTPAQEKTLIMRDDGGEATFKSPQQDASLGGKNCTEQNGTCGCLLREYDVDTNDPVARDGTFTRGAPIVDSGTPRVLLDCVQRDRRQVPVLISDPSTTLSFRLDAVDRQGNLATFPNRPTITTGDFSLENPRLTCAGDPCGCCIFQNPGNYPTECSDLPGLTGPPGSAYEGGVCIDIF